MFSIYRKEIMQFFSSAVGYAAVGLFLLISALFSWVFNDTSVLESGYAGMDVFFKMAPYVFMLLIPAITMRSFSEEYQLGTIEFLATKPLSDMQIIIGKWLAAFTLAVFSLLPTLIYYYSISQLGDPPGNIDSGGVWGSYFGLLFLAAAYVSVGLFGSSLSKNQFIAFIFSLFISYLLFDGFNRISTLDIFWGSKSYLVDKLGMLYHFNSLGRGIFDSRDAIYFISVIVLFFAGTRLVMESRKW